jgi:hypothetical protein
VRNSKEDVCIQKADPATSGKLEPAIQKQEYSPVDQLVRANEARNSSKLLFIGEGRFLCTNSVTKHQEAHMNQSIDQKDPSVTLSPDLVAQLPEPGRSHKVAALYASVDEAERVRQHLIDGGIAASEVTVLKDLPLPPDGGGNDEVLKDILVDGAIGTAVGTGVGAVGTVMLWAAGVTLFMASPVVAPLAMLGWFAGVGGIAGAVAGAASKEDKKGKEGKFSELVMDAIQSGNVVLVVRTHGETDTELAKEIIGKSLTGYHREPTEFK